MIRNVDGTIRYWSRGAEKLLWMGSARCAGNDFDEELRRNGYWEGHLIHKRRDGSKTTVSSHWDLQQNPTSHDQSIIVIEVNSRSKS